PRCIPSLAKPVYDLAQPYDCIVNELDLALVGIDWLMSDRLIATSAPSDVSMVARYEFEGNYNDSSVNLNHLTDPCGTAPGFDTGVSGAQALALDGVEDHLVVSGIGIDGNTPRTICCWVKSDSMVIDDFSLIFGFTGMADGSGGAGSHFNIGYTSTYISQLEPSFIAHVWGWEEQILPLDVDVWHHLAMTYDGTTIRYYGDGVEVDTDPDKSNVRNLVHGDRVHVGKRATSNLCFPGKVDDARIYSVVLSESEIAYLATQGAPTLQVPIQSVADVYQGEAPGSQWINFNDYALISDKYLEQVLWPTP
ncbi:MAG: LamG domain-containing protein, partial [Planctomycetota bacterium]